MIRKSGHRFSGKIMLKHNGVLRSRGRHLMTIRRREFLTVAGAAALSGALPRLARSADTVSVYDLERFGNARILHMTDSHAQLRPVFFREPSVNIGIGAMAGK